MRASECLRGIIDDVLGTIVGMRLARVSLKDLEVLGPYSAPTLEAIWGQVAAAAGEREVAAAVRARARGFVQSHRNEPCSDAGA